MARAKPTTAEVTPVVATTETPSVAGLSAEQAKALELLVGGALDSEVASTLGLHRKSVWRWRNEDPVFGAALAELQREAWEEAKRQLRGSVRSAVSCLVRALDDLDAPWAAKVAAAKDILDRAGLVAEKAEGVQISQVEFDRLVDALATERAEALVKKASK